MSASETYKARLRQLIDSHKAVIEEPNAVDPDWSNGWYERFKNPILTDRHAPISWRYDLNPETNPMLLERLGVNAAFNSGAILWEGRPTLVVRVEGYDRKSFFALAQSENGIDNFRFIGKPLAIPETDDPDVNVYDMRLTKHEDGWVYGLFCSERKDPDAPASDTSAATAAGAIVRTKDLENWERLPDLKTPSPQQRNVVLHPKFIEGQYAFYTRPQDGFIDAGTGGGIGWGLAKTMEGALIEKETIIDERAYHTIKEVKNGAGAAPIETDAGWIHIAHGVRGCAAGLRYVIYAFICEKDRPWKVLRRPGGFFIAPFKDERIGDVSNVVFINGLVERDNGEVLIYYASSDTRMHVARTNKEKLIDYVLNTPEDPMLSAACVRQRRELIEANDAYMAKAGDPMLDELKNAEARG